MAIAQKHFSVCIPNNGKDRVTLHSLSECQSHQTFLHQSNQLLVHIAPILSRTYGEAAFLANGHYWLRLCLAWSQFCRAVPLTLRRVSAAPMLSQSAANMVEYLSRWNKYHENKTVLDGNSRTKSQYCASLMAYFNMVPDSLYGPPTVYVWPGCGYTSEQDARAALDRAGRAAFLSRKLVSPATNKWTKQWRSTDFVWTHQIHANGPALWRLAFSDIKIVHDNGTSEDAYRKLQGRHFKETLAFMSNTAHQFDLRTYCVTSEPIRVLAIFFLKILDACCKELPGEVPAHLNLLNPSYSVLTAFHQYVSTLLFSATGHGRLCLLYDANNQSFQEWIHAGRTNGQVRQVRRCLLLADGWSFRRHDEKNRDLSFALSCAADARSNASLIEFRDNVFRLYLSFELCCAPAGIVWQLLAQNIRANTLQCNAAWISFWGSVAKIHDHGIADAECGHSFNNTNHDHVSFQSVVSRSLARDWDSGHRAAKTSTLQSFDSNSDGAPGGAAKKRGPGYYRSPLHAFLPEFKAQNHHGEFDSDGWQRLTEAFNALPPARQQVYRDQSQNSMRDAKAQRAALALVAQDTQESQVRSSSPGNTAHSICIDWDSAKVYNLNAITSVTAASSIPEDIQNIDVLSNVLVHSLLDKSLQHDLDAGVEFAISPGAVRDVRASMRAGNKPLSTVHSEYSKSVQQVTVPTENNASPELDSSISHLFQSPFPAVIS